jgi:hypothetical protein
LSVIAKARGEALEKLSNAEQRLWRTVTGTDESPPRPIWDWFQKKTPVAKADGWDTSANRGVG